MYKRALPNRITRNEKIWTCHLCGHTMKFVEFDKHLISEKHKTNLKQISEEQQEQEVDRACRLTNKHRDGLVTNQITFDMDPNLFNCHVCKCQIDGLPNTLLHICSNAHVENFTNYIKQNGRTMVQKTKKNLCNIATNKPSTETSLTDQSLTPILQSKSDNITCKEYANPDYCNICKTKITTTPNISQHIQGSLHQALESELKDSTSSSKSDCIVYYENSSSCQCNITKCEIGSEQNITHHDPEFLHHTMIHAQAVPDIKIIEQGNQYSLSKIALTSQEEAIGNNASIRNQDQLLEKVYSKPQFSRICYCRLCQIYIQNSILLKCHVSLHLHEEIDSSYNLDLIKLEAVRNDIVVLHCLLCDSVVCKQSIFHAHEELEKHLKTNRHLNRLLFFNHNKSDLSIPVRNKKMNEINEDSVRYHAKTNISFQLLCNVCDISLFDQNKKEHTFEKDHNNKLVQATVSYTYSIGKDRFGLKKNLTYYSCFICDQSFSELSKVLEHFETSEHQWKILFLNMMNTCTYMKFITMENLEMVECLSCKMIMHDFETAVNHVLETHHEEEIQWPKSNCNNMQVRNEINNKKVPDINPDAKDHGPVELLNLDFNNKQSRTKPSKAKPKPCRKDKRDERKNLYPRKVLLYGKQYIEFCIDSGVENIYNVDDEKISIFKLGLSLTFPYQSNRFCLLCEEQFSDDLESLFEHLQKQDHLAYINEIQVEDTKFYLESCPEQFSDLQLAKSYMHVLDQGIQCNVCNIQINDDDENIRQHIQQLAHKEKSKLWKKQSEHLFNLYLTIFKDIWYYAEHFFCEICDKKFKFEIDFVKHLTKLNHKKKVDKHLENKVDVIFNLCLSCLTYWFGTINSYEVHCKSDVHNGLLKKKDLMVPDFTSVASKFLSNVDENADILEKESNVVTTKEETDKETALLKAVIEAVNSVYPNAKAFIFGSRLSHLGFPSSDVDVFVDCENVYYKGSTKKQNQPYIDCAEDYFINTPYTWKVDQVLRDTRVPIMKMRHIPTKLNCDISFMNGLSVEKSKLVGLYIVAFPLCRKLILFMKKWLNLYHLSGSDCITTFAITWCAIFYLQQEGVLPPVYELLQQKNSSKIVDGWECGFVELFEAKSSDLPFKQYLKGFFTYLANFDYQKSVMCPYLGRTIDKRVFAYSDELPIEMDIYKNRFKNNEIEIFRFDSPLCIQDPIDLSQNITKALKKEKLRCFRQYCTLSAEKC